MIPRAQTILLGTLLLASLVMAGLLFRMRERAHQKLLAGQDSAPTAAPEVAAPQQATLMVANDDDNSLRGQIYSLPLPVEAGAKAKAVVGKLLDLYAAPEAQHSVAGGSGSIAQVFLLPVAQARGEKVSLNGSGALMAVVNLKGSFVASHPSGLETETLTVLSVCGTLHANLPQVTEVRFLVDGEVRPSLAGHADLTRTYLASDAVSAEPQPLTVHP
jgi:Sporulation and spore germination